MDNKLSAEAGLKTWLIATIVVYFLVLIAIIIFTVFACRVFGKCDNKSKNRKEEARVENQRSEMIQLD